MIREKLSPTFLLSSFEPRGDESEIEPVVGLVSNEPKIWYVFSIPPFFIVTKCPRETREVSLFGLMILA